MPVAREQRFWSPELRLGLGLERYSNSTERPDQEREKCHAEMCRGPRRI